ncbi:hypothetical protein DL93DRAFT_2173358 [Clavulina sp. PMI_390]|nr:hypothetical protein DL93DRAFT_2173358 [Clavulina sp. PMI_390]
MPIILSTHAPASTFSALINSSIHGVLNPTSHCAVSLRVKTRDSPIMRTEKEPLTFLVHSVPFSGFRAAFHTSEERSHNATSASRAPVPGMVFATEMAPTFYTQAAHYLPVDLSSVHGEHGSECRMLVLPFKTTLVGTTDLLYSLPTQHIVVGLIAELGSIRLWNPNSTTLDDASIWSPSLIFDKQYAHMHS